MKNIYKNPLFFLALTLLFLIPTFIFLKITFWSILILFLWSLVYIVFFTKIFKSIAIPQMFFLFVVGVLIVLNISLMIFVPVENEIEKADEKILTENECKPLYEKYHGVIFDIKADDLIGTVGITIEPSNCKAEIAYNMLFEIPIPKNYTQENMDVSEYKYVWGLRNKSEERQYNVGTGEIFPVYQNKNLLPEPLTFGTDQIDYNTNQVYNGGSTETFYQGWKTSLNFQEDTFGWIQNRNLNQIVDASGYIKKESYGDGYSYSTDTSLASKEGPVIKTFNISYTQR